MDALIEELEGILEECLNATDWEAGGLGGGDVISCQLCGASANHWGGYKPSDLKHSEKCPVTRLKKVVETLKNLSAGS
tara:strand:+ start:2089 stop:2322 length:234 start_codon:yes stop_codon:yes gene_type:complete